MRTKAGAASVLLLALSARLLAADAGLAWFLLGVTALAAAAACTAYVGASLAAEHALTQTTRELEQRSADRREQRRGRRISPQQVRQALVDGAATPSEVAEVLDVYEHVARRMLDVLVDDGVAQRRDGWVVLLQAGDTRRLPAGPRWIDA